MVVVGGSQLDCLGHYSLQASAGCSALKTFLPAPQLQDTYLSFLLLFWAGRGLRELIQNRFAMKPGLIHT